MKNSRLAIGFTAATAIVLIVIVWVAVGLSSKKATPTAAKARTVTVTTSSPSPVPNQTSTADVLSESEAQATSSVANYATGFLNAAADLATNSKLEEALSKGNSAQVPLSFKSYFRFVGGLQSSKTFTSISYLTVLTLASSIKQAQVAAGASKIQVLSGVKLPNYVYVDKQVGNAFVPATIYLGASIGYSLEFVYVNGGWKFVPYSLVDEVNSVNLALAKAQSSSSTGKSSTSK